MKCPECVDTGQRSILSVRGSSTTLLGGGEPYWDEDGVWHMHDWNKHTSSYMCSNGHHILVIRRHSCPAGDFDEQEEVRYLKP